MEPTEQKALLLTEAKGPLAVGTIPVPKPGPGEILIKIHAVALNPADWFMQASGLFIEKYPTVLGLDRAGTVEELGEGVTGFAKGDRVISDSRIGLPTSAGFQQYSLAGADLTTHDAATLPVAVATAVVGLYAIPDGIGLTPSWESAGRGKYQGEPIIAFGGSSSVGQYVIQFAKLSGFNPIIATASPHNTEALEQLGATHVIDRSLSADAIRAEVASITSAPIKSAYVAIHAAEVQDAAYDLLSPGGMLVTTVPIDVDEKKRTKDKRVERAFGSLRTEHHRALGESLYTHFTALLEEGVIKPTRLEVLPDGLEGIKGGLERLKKGVSNLKFVAHPQETV